MFPGAFRRWKESAQSGQTYYFSYEDYLAIRNEAQLVGALSPALNREDIRAVSGQVYCLQSRLRG